MEAFGTPRPPGTGFGFLMSPKSSFGGCGFTLTSAASWRPWYPPSNLMILSRPVAARARRTECMVASVPLEPKRTISTGKRSQISSASSHSMSCGMPNMVPVERRPWTAFMTAG